MTGMLMGIGRVGRGDIAWISGHAPKKSNGTAHEWTKPIYAQKESHCLGLDTTRTANVLTSQNSRGVVNHRYNFRLKEPFKGMVINVSEHFKPFYKIVCQ